MEVKDRIKQVMEDQQMTQQEFAEFLHQSPATLSSIFNGRTRPTLKVVDDMKSKIPQLNIEWLLYGTGEKYRTSPSGPAAPSPATDAGDSLMFHFDDAPAYRPSAVQPSGPAVHGAGPAHQERVLESLKIPEKQPRKVTEIRVYYDDQTFETFVPSKK